MSWFKRRSGSQETGSDAGNGGARAADDRRQIDWGAEDARTAARIEELEFDFDLELELDADPDFVELPPEPAPAPIPRPAAPAEMRAPQPAPVEARATIPAAPRAPATPPRADGRPAVPAEGGAGWLVVDNIKKSFKTRPVVRGVSLAVRRGEAVGLLGPNGAGKTTVFYMITGLIPADTGRITLDGHDITRLPMYRRARLGHRHPPPGGPVFRGLKGGGKNPGAPRGVEPNRRLRRQQLDDLLEEFNITRLRKSPAIALSGGERRRCEIARALAGRPTFMLLDEPFAGIDPIAVGDIQLLVRHLTARGIGVLITDHNVRETLGLIDRAYIIHSGEVLMEGSPHDIVSSPEVRRLYLGEGFTL